MDPTAPTFILHVHRDGSLKLFYTALSGDSLHNEVLNHAHASEIIVGPSRWAGETHGKH